MNPELITPGRIYVYEYVWSMYTITKCTRTSADGTDNPEALVGPGRNNIEPWLAKYVRNTEPYGRVRYVCI